MDQYTQLLYGLAAVAIIGFVGWTIKSIIGLKGDVKDLELRNTREYVRNADLKELKDDLRALSVVVYEIAGKLGVPVRRD